MEKILVFGHQNPDTDAITSAITYTHLLNQLGYSAEAVALGEANDETRYALETFGYEPLRVITEAKIETDTVALVDHNEFQQSVQDISEVRIFAVVDHHRISNFQTADPLYYLAKPIGCTQSVIYGLYQEKGIAIPKNIAGLMLSGLLSDTLLLKSPTCTPNDIEIATKLAEIAEVNLEEYGLNMLKSGTNVDKLSEVEIADGDAKSFPLRENATFRIGQVNVVDFNDVLKRKALVLSAMKKLATENNYDAFLLTITNILDNNSIGLVYGRKDLLSKVEEAFNAKIIDHELSMPGIVSRKKQIVPPLTNTLS